MLDGDAADSWKQQPCQVHNLKEITVAIAGHPAEPVQVCPLVTTPQHFIHIGAEMIEATAVPALSWETAV